VNTFLVRYHISLDHVDNVIQNHSRFRNRATRGRICTFFEIRSQITTAGNRTERIKGHKLDRKKVRLARCGFALPKPALELAELRFN